jgi:diguanylate cyclase (GGDEF)-like protein
MMISLRKHIDNYTTRQKDSGGNGIQEPVLSEFRTMLLAIGQCVDRAVPSLGVDLNQKMTGLERNLVQPATAADLAQTNEQARKELSVWADRASSHHKDIERELSEIINIVSRAGESTIERDQKYTREIGDLTGRLGHIAEENDLAQIRRSIIESMRSLKACVTRMAEESKASVDQLTAQVQECNARLEDAERVSHTDPLTDLANRRAFEKHLDARIAARQSFFVIMIDLNDFKLVNDRCGHIAGDDLLKQFAAKLKSQFNEAEMVGRLGGDEFVVVTTGRLSDASAKVERVRRGALGEYRISQGDRSAKTVLRASIGVAAWDGSEPAFALLARVDKELYRDKQPDMCVPA